MAEPPMAPPRRRSDSIHVCALSAVPHIVARSNASCLISCLQDAIPVETPERIERAKHLRLLIDDISIAMPGYVAPDQNHIRQLIDFALAWGGEGPMVVHCWAGISRSTAAAFTVLCAINPLVSEAMIAGRLRQASPTAHPNRLMVRLADLALGRGGRMVRAIEAIGPGSYATEALPFALTADQSAAGDP